MTDTGAEARAQQAAAAAMAAAIERAEADLSLAEEPARFVAALEAAAPPVLDPSAAGRA